MVVEMSSPLPLCQREREVRGIMSQAGLAAFRKGGMKDFLALRISYYTSRSQCLDYSVMAYFML